MLQEQIRQNIHDIRAVQLARNAGRQTFAYELIDNIEDAISAPVPNKPSTCAPGS